jgi:aspartyl-tRNA(Asn)/glutamyl-tRNA(Gln) amidotransferase subunit C
MLAQALCKGAFCKKSYNGVKITLISVKYNLAPGVKHLYTCTQMADLTRDDVLKLARLARLKLSEDEIAKYQKELAEILEYVEQLDAVDVSGLEPTSQVTGLTNVTRADEEIDYGYKSLDLLKNVPATEGDLIKVKRMIG